MNPILEPIICAGLLAAFLSIISLTGLISTDSSTYQIFDALRSAVFYFLPILMAMSCAKRLGRQPLSSSGFSSKPFYLNRSTMFRD